MIEITNKRGLMIILSSPSGAGKTTIAKQLLADDENIKLSVSITTRTPRKNETEGKDYYFVNEEQFLKLKNDNMLLEHAKVFNHHYGTPRKAVEDNLVKGNDMLFDIDWQGAQQLRETAESDLVRIFILPPSIEDLKNRLTSRSKLTGTKDTNRMMFAASEISHWQEYDWVLINEDLQTTIHNIQTILHSERLRRRRQIGIGNFVRSLRDNAEVG